MNEQAKPGLDWAGLPAIATVPRLLCRELTLQNEYLRLENRILKEKASRPGLCSMIEMYCSPMTSTQHCKGRPLRW